MEKHTITKPVLVFLSYSSKDKEILGEIRTNLLYCGFDVFLAHEDIEPSAEWQIEIIRNLIDCDIFIPVISKNFRDSNWTDQESGFALALDKQIIPITIDIVPYGFLGKLQTLKLSKNILDSCIKVHKVLSEKKPELFMRTQNNFITGFFNSVIDDEIKAKIKILNSFDDFNKKQIENLIIGYINNNSIRNYDIVKEAIDNLYNKYFDVIDTKIKERYVKVKKVNFIIDNKKYTFTNKDERLRGIISILSETGEKFTTKEISELIDTKLTTTRRDLNELTKLGFVEWSYEKRDNRWYRVYRLGK